VAALVKTSLPKCGQERMTWRAMRPRLDDELGSGGCHPVAVKIEMPIGDAPGFPNPSAFLAEHRHLVMAIGWIAESRQVYRERTRGDTDGHAHAAQRT
jgi:hypothetical protein